jgi:hypothetical protein
MQLFSFVISASGKIKFAVELHQTFIKCWEYDNDIYSTIYTGAIVK